MMMEISVIIKWQYTESIQLLKLSLNISSLNVLIVVQTFSKQAKYWILSSHTEYLTSPDLHRQFVVFKSLIIERSSGLVSRISILRVRLVRGRLVKYLDLLPLDMDGTMSGLL